MESTLGLIPIIYAKFMVFVLASTRISTMLYTFILFRHEVITGRIMVTLSSVLAVYVVLLSPTPPAGSDVFSLQMLGQEVLQLLIGFMTGLILNFVFEVFVVFGQIISTQIGLSLASLIDPRFGSITNITQFYVIVVSLIFLLMNGHLFIIKLIMDSFTNIPVTHIFLPKNLMSDALSYSSIMFSGAVLLSLAMLIAMLLTNTALAVMTKFAPQLNIFSVGINIALVFGLFCAYLTFNLFVDQGTNLLQQGLDFLQQTILKMK